MKFHVPAVIWLHRWLLVFAVLSLVVLALNLALLVVSSRLPLTRDGTNILMRADCTSVSQWNVLSHSIINIMSTALLAASNYSMQLAMAPSRDDVNKEHARRRWLNIGVPSIRNLRAMSLPRQLCWALLLLSSFPLHLVYNSAVLATQTATKYIVAELDVGFLDTGAATILNKNWTNPDKETLKESERDLRQYFRDSIVPNAAQWENLTLETCASVYSSIMLTTHRNLILVVPHEDQLRMPGLVSDAVDNSWMCNYYSGADAECQTQRAKFGAYDRKRGLMPAEPLYCLAEPLRQKCNLEIYTPFLITVILCNGVKTIVMVMLFFVVRGHSLNTLGDAITSFLQQPDPSTEGFGAYDYKQLLTLWTRNIPAGSVQWRRRNYRRFNALSRRRLVVAWAVFFVTVTVVSAFFIMALVSDTEAGRRSTAFSLSSFTTKDYTSIVGWETLATASFASLVVLVNTPQFLFSALYFMYNALLSSFLQASEWNAFSLRPCTLRVTRRSTGQRSAYWLQIPPKYAIPLLIFGATSHWLISQAFFLSKISFVDYSGQSTNGLGRIGFGREHSGRDGELLVANYSSLYLMISFVVGFLALVALYFISRKRLVGNMVLQSGCSAAIAAACHHAQRRGEKQALHEAGGHKYQDHEKTEDFCQNEEDEWARPLMWGEITRTVEGRFDLEERLFLGLKADSVGEVVEGRMYS